MKNIKYFLPTPLKKYLKVKWLWMRSPVLVLDDFINPGVKFEVKTAIEKQRVLNIGHEKELLSNFISTIESGNVFYDIGCCIGMYTIHAARLGAKVIAFEPDPGYRKRLMRNVEINKLDTNVQVISWAVSDQAGLATLYTDGILGKSPSLQTSEDRGAIKILTNSLDQAVGAGHIPPPDIIKMDIEGAEILALRGMEQLLRSGRRPVALFIEFHPEFLPQFNANLSDCEKLLTKYGYEIQKEIKRQNQIQRIYTLK